MRVISAQETISSSSPHPALTLFSGFIVIWSEITGVLAPFPSGPSSLTRAPGGRHPEGKPFPGAALSLPAACLGLSHGRNAVRPPKAQIETQSPWGCSSPSSSLLCCLECDNGLEGSPAQGRPQASRVLLAGTSRAWLHLYPLPETAASATRLCVAWPFSSGPLAGGQAFSPS